MTLEAVNEKERRTKGRQYFQGIRPQMFQSCFLWSLKVGLQVTCQGGIKPKKAENVGSCHPEDRPWEGTFSMVAKGAGILLPGGILRKSPAEGMEQSMAYCFLHEKILLVWVKNNTTRMLRKKKRASGAGEAGREHWRQLGGNLGAPRTPLTFCVGLGKAPFDPFL